MKENVQPQKQSWADRYRMWRAGQGAAEIQQRMKGDFSQMRFVQSHLDSMQLKEVGRTPLSELGRYRTIYTSKEGDTFYSSDSIQWANYELLRDFLDLSPVVYTKKYGMLSYEVPRRLFREQPLKYQVDAEVLRLVFNDPDHGNGGRNASRSPLGYHQALYDTEQTWMFWSDDPTKKMDFTLSRLDVPKLRALCDKTREMHAFFSSEEGLREIEDVFKGRGIVPFEIQPFSRESDGTKGPEVFRTELVRRLAIVGNGAEAYLASGPQ